MKLLINYILFIVAVILLIVVGFFTFVPSILSSIFTRKLSVYYKNLALSIDQFGNTLIAPVANVILIKKNGYKFGNIDETISSVLGKNQELGTMRFTAWLICWILDKLDKNHCRNSIDYNTQIKIQ